MPYKDPEAARICNRDSKRRARAEGDPDKIRAERRESMRRLRAQDPEVAAEKMRRWRRENVEHIRARKARETANDRAVSTRGRKPWTPQEIEIALREDLTIAQRAALVSRTRGAVQRQLNAQRSKTAQEAAP